MFAEDKINKIDYWLVQNSSFLVKAHLVCNMFVQMEVK